MLSEAAIMAQLSHENIVSIIGYSLSKVGTITVVVQYCEGGSLSSFFAKHSESFSSRFVNKFALDIARAMAFISSKEFVHRDLAVWHHDDRMACNNSMLHLLLRKPRFSVIPRLATFSLIRPIRQRLPISAMLVAFRRTAYFWEPSKRKLR